MKQTSISTWTLAALFLFVTNLAAAQTAPPQRTDQAGTQGDRSTVALPTTPSAAPAAVSVEKTAVVPAIGSGDLLKVSILGAPESDQEVRVGADGNVSLHFLGGVHLAGLTIEEAEAEITKKLVDRGFFTDPQVSVFVKEYPTEGVSVLGEVKNPGVYPVLGSRRLFDVLSLAGGTTDKAGEVIAVTHRNRPQEPVTINRSGDPSTAAQANVEVFPGDTVVVGKAGIVYVVGDVKKTGGYVMENGRMTVLQAISMAEGTNPNANLNKAVLIRSTPDGRQQIPLELKKILASKAPDVPVQAEDIIFIPNSASKSAGKRSLEAILQAATLVAVYHP